VEDRGLNVTPDHAIFNGEAMTVITKLHALTVARRAYGHDYAESIAHQLPDKVDFDNAKDMQLLFELGLTPDRLFDALGAEF
jgi:hypothetical protein